ncbi:hypothetical protein DBR40_02535 [Pedobacter sp. KBW01]|nr:hypothetical protein DBR40_02535 [Pedobacter sp. KBW01]
MFWKTRPFTSFNASRALQVNLCQPQLNKPDRTGKPVTKWRLEVDSRAVGTDTHRNLLSKKDIFTVCFMFREALNPE